MFPMQVVADKGFENSNNGAVRCIFSAAASSHLHMICIDALNCFDQRWEVKFGRIVIYYLRRVSLGYDAESWRRSTYLVVQPLHACYPPRLLERVDFDIRLIQSLLEAFVHVIQNLAIDFQRLN